MQAELVMDDLSHRTRINTGAGQDITRSSCVNEGILFLLAAYAAANKTRTDVYVQHQVDRKAFLSARDVISGLRQTSVGCEIALHFLRNERFFHHFAVTHLQMAGALEFSPFLFFMRGRLRILIDVYLKDARFHALAFHALFSLNSIQ